jgi:hypothetical protein
MPETKQAASSCSYSNMKRVWILARILTTLIENSQNLPVNVGIVFQIKPWPWPFASFPIHNSVVMQLFRAANNNIEINHKLEAVA